MAPVKIASDPFRVPEQGELVEVRRRQWLVSDVEPYKPDGDGYREQHLVTLESIEVDAIREDLGSVGGILCAQIQDAMLGKSRRLDADLQDERQKRAKRMLPLEKELTARIAKLHEKLQQSKKDENLSPENVRKAVETALALAGKPPLEEGREGSGSVL